MVKRVITSYESGKYAQHCTVCSEVTVTCSLSRFQYFRVNKGKNPNRMSKKKVHFGIPSTKFTICRGYDEKVPFLATLYWQVVCHLPYHFIIFFDFQAIQNTRSNWQGRVHLRLSGVLNSTIVPGFSSPCLFMTQTFCFHVLLTLQEHYPYIMLYCTK